MAKKSDIRFLDLPKREEQAVQALRKDKAPLDERKARGALGPEEKKTLDRITEVLAAYDAANPPGKKITELADPLFVGVRDAFQQNRGLLGKVLQNHDNGVMKGAPKLDFDDVVRVSLVIGLLAADETTAPRVMATLAAAAPAAAAPAAAAPAAAAPAAAAPAAAAPAAAAPAAAAPAAAAPPAWTIVSDPADPERATFSKAFFAAVGEMHGVLPLAGLVLSMLEEEGDNNGKRAPSGEVDIVEFAKVIRCLRGKGVDEREPQLRRRINECLDIIQRVGGDQQLSDIQIALPDLNQIGDYQIQAENVRLMGAMICAAMLDELRVFPVVDRLVELSQNGTLAIGRGTAGEMLYRYWKETPNRISEAERRNFYAVTIGVPGGEANGMTNREFNDLWMRFVSSVSSLVRQKTIDKLLQQSIPAAIGQQQVRKAARDLAFNLSGHGYGMALYAAIEFQLEINKIIALLSHQDILSAFGARDMWQVIDQVATLELGGARNSARYRTLATCGAIITAWLANNVKKYNRSTSEPVIDLVAVTSIDPPTAGDKATREPKDYDLVNACELWLADTATSEERIEQLAREPREAPVMTSKPVQIPAIAREMLQQAGLPGLGFGMSRRM